MDLSSIRRQRQALKRSLAEDRLIEFIELLWPVVEPGRPFVRGWAIEAICEHLEAVTRGDIKRLLINVPPGFMKSLATCVFWPAWEWGPRQRPDLRYIFASYVGSLSLGNNLKLRRLVESDLYREIWPYVALADDQSAKTFFENTSTGFALATSVGGAVMGKRGDRFILDDPNNTKTVDSEARTEEALQFVTEVMPTRVNDEATFAEITIMQRTAERDVAGHGLSTGHYDCHLCIPMEWRRGHPYIAYPEKPTAIGWCDPRSQDGELAFPERFTADGVAKLKADLSSHGGDYAVAGQLDQLPIPRGGGMFAEDWFSRVIDVTEVPTGGCTVRGWDLAASKGSTSPFTASVKMRLVRGTVYVMDATNDRVDAAGVEDHVASVSLADDPDTIIDVPQDPGAAGKVQVTTLARRLHGRTYFYSPETGSKEMRAMPFASQCKAGNIVLVAGAWNKTFIKQACSFPRGMFKDLVDAASRTYARAVQRAGRATASDGGEVGYY
jgi:predicted phage terminase large subunit-like protein